MTAAQSIEQKTRALVIANDARIARAQLAGRLRALGRREGPLEAARVLENERECALYARMEIGRFLLKVPGVGKHAANMMLRHVNQAWPVSPWRLIGDLNSEQRTGLIAELREFANRPARR